MSAYLIAHLPCHAKSLEAIEFMQNYNFFYRISTNLPLMHYVLSSGAGEHHKLATVMGLSADFESGNEELHLVSQLTRILPSETRIKIEEDSWENPPSKENVDPRECIFKVENDFSTVRQSNECHLEKATNVPTVTLRNASMDVDQTIEQRQKESMDIPLTATEQKVQTVQDEPVLQEDDQRMEVEDAAVDELLDTDDSMLSHDFPHNDELEEDLLEQDAAEEEAKEEEPIEEEEHEDKDNDDDEAMVEEREDIEEGRDHDEKTASNHDVKKSTRQSSIRRLLFACPVKNCPSSFKTFNQLEDHMKDHSGPQDFFCDVCKKNFTTESLAMTHIRQRETKECCGCAKTFSDKCKLVEHLRSHTGERPFICETCGKGCSSNNNLKAHTKMHTGEKRYSCKYCEKRFSKTSHKKIHERMHTGEKPFECSHCGIRYSDRSSLVKHNRSRTCEKSNFCEICDKKFAGSDELNEHIRKIHVGLILARNAK